MLDAALLDRLTDPALYNPPPPQVEVIHTHISTVLIAPPFVYKLKKPKNLGFLDFTTPAARREGCRREVALNRRLTSDVYLAVVSLVATGGVPAWSDEDRDDALEWAVKMRYLEPNGFLDHLIAVKQATPAHIRRVAARYTAFAAAQPPCPLAARYAGHDALAALCHDNVTALEPFVGRWVDAAWLALSLRFVDGFLGAFTALMAQRCETAVVDGHGDLHAQHVHFADGDAAGALNIIDTIEFADAFRVGDIVADEAFLLLDLKRLGRHDLARVWLQAVNELRPDAARATLLPFYLHYRAMVRAKVACLRAASPEVPEFERPDAVREAVEYLRWAARFAAFGAEPTVLALAGPSGAGKSTLAGRLADVFGAPRHASDQIRRGLAGLAPNETSGSETGRGIYAPELTDRTYNTLIHSAVRDAEDAGLGLADATFLTPDLRHRLGDLCRQRGVRLVWLALDPDRDIARARILARGSGESEATVAVLDTQLQQWQVPSAGEGDMILVLGGDADVATVGQRLVRTHLDLLRHT